MREKTSFKMWQRNVRVLYDNIPGTGMSSNFAIWTYDKGRKGRRMFTVLSTGPFRLPYKTM